MFRIRRVFDSTTPSDAAAVAAVQDILQGQFGAVSKEEIAALPGKLLDPLKYHFRSVLLVAESAPGKVRGFALLLHAPDLNFCFLDFISAAVRGTGGGVGGALYTSVRDEALKLGSVGLFMECLPDTPDLSPDPKIRKQNAQRLKFYERFGAFPVAGTLYETPVNPGESDPPFLVFDALGQQRPLSRETARRIVRAILVRKYSQLCAEDYIESIVSSFRDDPVRLRPPKYVAGADPLDGHPIPVAEDRRILLLVNDKHQIHHVRERGYVESPVRISSILKRIEPTGLFLKGNVVHFGEEHITEVHSHAYVNYFKAVCRKLPEGKSVYPYVFPIRNQTRAPTELAVRAGYFCFDTFTPLNRNAFLAAKRAVDCALTGAGEVLKGRRLAYALVRPPGHHAERNAFGGFCYFNNASVAAHFLSKHGTVALLDLDYHHGNGHQDIFYRRRDVLTISIHGHPRFAYPYFTGFEGERGEDEGLGFNINHPLPEDLNGSQYLEVLKTCIKRIRQFRPRYLVVALGLDPAKADPTGSWSLRAADFEKNGEIVGELRIPTLVVQEGGYNTRNLGVNALHFFRGLHRGAWETKVNSAGSQSQRPGDQPANRRKKP